MSVGLLDVNVLIALFDPAHPHHEIAHLWFAQNHQQGWATCGVTIAGCVRILSHPAYHTVEATPADVVARLTTVCQSPWHHFWAEKTSLLDRNVFRPEFIASHKHVTDVCLLGLACGRQGKLVTLDRSISLKAVAGAQPKNLELL